MVNQKIFEVQIFFIFCYFSLFFEIYKNKLVNYPQKDHFKLTPETR